MLETGRKDKELEGLSLLGNQGTKYKFGYDPDILEVITNIQTMTTLLNSTVLNLQVYVQ